MCESVIREGWKMCIGGQSLKRLIADQVCAAAKVSNLGGASQ